MSEFSIVSSPPRNIRIYDIEYVQKQKFYEKNAYI